VDSDDGMVFTVIKPPRLDAVCEPSMAAGRRQAKNAGLGRRDLDRVIGRVRCGGDARICPAVQAGAPDQRMDG